MARRTEPFLLLFPFFGGAHMSHRDHPYFVWFW